jgi:hypothetical protein
LAYRPHKRSEPPPGDVDERTMLVGYLDQYRDVMVMKIEGLSEEQARWRPAPTANSLINLIVHLTGVERRWFELVIAGQPIERNREAEFGEVRITVEEAVAAYLHQCARSNEIMHEFASDDECRGEPGVAVRWVLMHMLEETARHAGHADITRELIDGSLGWSRTDPG